MTDNLIVINNYDNNKENNNMKFEQSFGYNDPHKLAEWHEHELGGSFFIAPLGNPAQIEVNLKKAKVTDIENLEETLYDRKVETCEILAQSILLDWKEVFDEGDKEIKYTIDSGTKALYSYDEFRAWVVEQAEKLRQKQTKVKEDTQKK